jgi:outer membrane immunogenic protein
MKKCLLAAIALVVLCLTSAYAADMPTKAPVYKAPPQAALSWTGFYAGLQAGYGWSPDPTYTYLPVGRSVSFGTHGFVGGVTAGYNWQVHSWVLGLEGDLSYADVSGNTLGPFGAAPCYVQGCTAKLSWFGTGRVRAGYAFDRFLPYVTGGFAVGGVKGTADLGSCASPTSCGFDTTRWGWTIGGGLEYRLAYNWSAKIEYLYINLGSPDFPVTPGFVTPFDATSNLTTHIVRAGLNYHF